MEGEREMTEKQEEQQTKQGELKGWRIKHKTRTKQPILGVYNLNLITDVNMVFPPYINLE